MLNFFRKKLLGLAIPALCLCFCCSQKRTPETAVSSAPDIPYDLQNPSLSLTMSIEYLQEISALSPTDKPGVYLAIADEKGEFYFVDGTSTGDISERVLFRDRGDFEGAEMVAEHLWAVKSNGKLYEISQWKNSEPVVMEYETPLSKADDVEGLGYDAKRHALLLACKGNPDSSYYRNIYAFDLRDKKMQDQPVYSIDPVAVNNLVPYLETEKHDYFSPSGVAVHPKTGNLYVISAALKRLVVIDMESGAILWAARLDKKLLPQPEGIAFDQDGNLLISSEGKKGYGRLLMFQYIKK